MDVQYIYITLHGCACMPCCILITSETTFFIWSSACLLDSAIWFIKFPEAAAWVACIACSVCMACPFDSVAAAAKLTLVLPWHGCWHYLIVPYPTSLCCWFFVVAHFKAQGMRNVEAYLCCCSVGHMPQHTLYIYIYIVIYIYIYACLYISMHYMMYCASDMCGCVVSRNIFMGFAVLDLSSSNPRTSSNFSISKTIL